MKHYNVLGSVAFGDALPFVALALVLALVLTVHVVVQRRRIWKLERELAAMHEGVAAMAAERHLLENLRRDVRRETARLEQERLAARAAGAVLRRTLP